MVTGASDGPTPSAKLSTKAKIVAWAAPHVERADESIIGRYYNRLLEVEFIDRSIALAAKLFISFFPFLIAVAAFSPNSVRESLRESIVNRLGLSGDAATSVAAAFGGTADQAKAAIGFLGLVMLLLYATSFTTALQRTFFRAWRRPSGGGIRNQSRGLMWLTGMIFFSVISGAAGRIFTGYASVAASVGLLVVTFFGWWWTSWLMLRGEVKWRPLLPGAGASTLALGIYVLTANVWMPRILANNEADFGTFGVTLSLVTYFVGVSFVIVMAAALSPILAEGHGPFAHWLCGGPDGPLQPGVPAPLPGPSHRLRLSRALGIPDRDGTIDQMGDT